MPTPKPKQRRPRKVTPFALSGPTERDERVPVQLWGLPRRIAEANDAGPRYNQTEIAELAGISQSVVSKLAGSQNLYGLRVDTLYRLAGVLGVSVSWLLGETPRAPKRRGKAPRSKRRRAAKP